MGVRRFTELVQAKFFDGQVIYRVMPGFLMQFGTAVNPQVQAKWDAMTFRDEPKVGPFEHDTVSFAGHGTDSRSCHMFIALAPDGLRLGAAPHETALGKVTSGTEVLDAIVQNAQASGYGDLTHLQTELKQQGIIAAMAYPKLDKFRTCSLIAKQVPNVASTQGANAVAAPNRAATAIPSFTVDAAIETARKLAAAAAQEHEELMRGKQQQYQQHQQHQHPQQQQQQLQLQQLQQPKGSVTQAMPGRAVAGGKQVRCSTTAGAFTISLDRSWSPLGVDRFLELVNFKFFDGQLIYRVIPDFLFQFGVAAIPQVQAHWDGKRFKDEPKVVPFEHGTVSFAGAGQDSRSCHIFVALAPQGTRLGSAPHETPIGKVTAGLDVLDRIVANAKAANYGDLTDLQQKLISQGNSAAARHTKLDAFNSCHVLGAVEL